MDHIYKCKDCGSEFRVSETFLSVDKNSPHYATPWCPDCDSDVVEDTGKTKTAPPSLNKGE